MSQGKNESLKSFMTRFNAAATEVSNPDENTTFFALVSAIHPETEFGRWLKMKRPIGKRDFHKKANQYLQLEEAEELERKATNTTTPANPTNDRAIVPVPVSASSVQAQNNSPPNENPKRKGQKNDRAGEKRYRGHDGKAWTPLNETPENIYLATMNTEKYEKPPKSNILLLREW